MKGYKGMRANMTCRGMQYEIGKSYHVDGAIEMCRNGLHFCENLNEVFSYYDYEADRYFEVEASGVIIKSEYKCVTSDLRIIGEVPKIKVNKDKYSNGYGNGDGYSVGNGYGYSVGNGYGDGDGDGDGNGNGNGNSDGDGDGDGNGNGNGDGTKNINKILMFKED